MKGFAQVYLIAAVAALVAIGGAYAWGRTDGRTIERAAWEKRDNDALRSANAEIDAAHRKLREQERSAAERLAQVSAEYQKEVSNAREETRRRVAAVAAGTLRLRDPAASNQTCADRVPDAPAAAERRDGAEAGYLSGTAAQFLLELTAEADEVARQLAACQAVVRQDRLHAPGT